MERIIKSYRSLIVILFSAGVLSLSGCSDIGGVNLFSVEDDAALGEQFNQELQQSGEVKILNNPQVTAYVQNIVNEILKSPDIKYENVFPYKVYLVADDNTVNAFALPGGYIYVYTGIMKFLDNEASLAGVLAHEIAHSEERHATERITEQYGLSALLGIVLGQNPSQLEQLAGNLLGGLTLLANSRADEAEADVDSFRYLKATPYYPGAILYFFEKIDDNRNALWIEKWLQSHPTPEDRITEIKKLIQEANLPAPTESNLFSQRYKQMVAQLP